MHNFCHSQLHYSLFGSTFSNSESILKPRSYLKKFLPRIDSDFRTNCVRISEHAFSRLVKLAELLLLLSFDRLISLSVL